MNLKFTSKIFSLLLSLGLLAALIFGVTHAQALEDWWKLRGYDPPATVVKLASEDTMTPLAVHIFYVNHPDLESNAVTFRQLCTVAEQTIVLGCYHSDQNGIDIYKVEDSRLNGVQEVTAAHEMLHAAYDRLSSSDRKNIDNMLESFYQNSLSDQRIKDTIDSYKKSEPNDVVNEMHSVFGTEVSNLPVPLESYYKKYFSNRAAVVAFANGYEGEFTSRINQINDDDQRLAQMKVQIQADENSLDAQLSGLQAERAQIERSGSDADISQYNARVTAYNSGVKHLQNEISAYNALVEQRNAIATELRSLQGSLDTRLTAQTTR